MGLNREHWRPSLEDRYYNYLDPKLETLVKLSRACYRNVISLRIIPKEATFESYDQIPADLRDMLDDLLQAWLDHHKWLTVVVNPSLPPRNRINENLRKRL